MIVPEGEPSLDGPFGGDDGPLGREERDPWERPAGTTFYFVNDGIETALKRARDNRGGDIRIARGPNTIVQYLNAGLVDGFAIELAPVFLGSGTPLFEGIDGARLEIEIVEAIHSPKVAHLRSSVHSR